jgi:hypothetical protein
MLSTFHIPEQTQRTSSSIALALNQREKGPQEPVRPSFWSPIIHHALSLLKEVKQLNFFFSNNNKS